MALLKAHLEMAYPELADLVARSAAKDLDRQNDGGDSAKIHRAFGLKFWALISGGGALSGAARKFLERAGIRPCAGLRHDGDQRADHPQPSLPRGQWNHRQADRRREVKLGPDGEVLVRGASISAGTWSGGALHQRDSEWLPTGDLATMEPSGELRFLGRKSETIVTSSGLNVHPEDLEARIEEQPGVAACAVVPVETADGPEPCAVIASRGSGDSAAAAIENANTHLADFQRVRRWVLYPEPDLPRTSTGKVRRKAVAQWLNKIQAASTQNGAAKASGNGSFAASQDWLLALIAQITGDAPPGVGDELLLSEDLRLDSLGRVQLAAAIEDRLGIVSQDGMLDQVQTLGQLRRLIAGEQNAPQAPASASQAAVRISVEAPMQAAGSAAIAPVNE